MKYIFTFLIFAYHSLSAQFISVINTQITTHDTIFIHSAIFHPSLHPDCGKLLNIQDSIANNTVTFDLLYNITPASNINPIGCLKVDTVKINPLPAGKYFVQGFWGYIDSSVSPPRMVNRWKNFLDSFQVVITTSLPKSTSQSFEIYPNPIQHQFQIKNSKVSDFEIIQFWNLQGQLVKETPYNSTTINVSDLSSGVYIARLIGEERMEQIKIVKE